MKTALELAYETIDNEILDEVMSEIEDEYKPLHISKNEIDDFSLANTDIIPNRH